MSILFLAIQLILIVIEALFWLHGHLL